MGEWKTSLSLRIKIDTKTELEKYAKKEMRTLGNIGEVLIEWALVQLQKAGGTEKLLRRTVPVPRNPDGNYNRTSSQKPWQKRKDPPGFPGDDHITQRYNEVKEMVREERGLCEAELDHMMRSVYEEAVRRYAPIRRAIGMLFRAMREERNLTRLQLADQSNVSAREIGRIERGASDFSLGDMMRLCTVLKYPLETLMEDVSAAVGDLNSLP
jgi:DNA-binding XRE family transcriptional regulator